MSKVKVREGGGGSVAGSPATSKVRARAHLSSHKLTPPHPCARMCCCAGLLRPETCQLLQRYMKGRTTVRIASHWQACGDAMQQQQQRQQVRQGVSVCGVEEV